MPAFCLTRIVPVPAQPLPPNYPRPLMSVPKLTEGDKLAVICKEKEALVQTPNGQTVARFKKKQGLYVCLMRIKNPKWQPFMRPA